MQKPDPNPVGAGTHCSPEGHPFGDWLVGAHATAWVVHATGGLITAASGAHWPPDAAELETVNIAPDPQPVIVVWTLGHAPCWTEMEPQLDEQLPLPNCTVTAPQVDPLAGPHEQLHVAPGVVASEVPPSK